MLKDWQRVSCVLHLNLIAWWLQEQEAEFLRDLLTQVLSPTQGPIRELYEPEQEDEEESEESQWVLSSWTLAHFGSGKLGNGMMVYMKARAFSVL